MGNAHGKMMFNVSTSIELYNGNVLHYGKNGKQVSVFHLMQKCAESAKLSRNAFYSCLITNEDLSFFALPYSKNVSFELEGPFYLRYILEHNLPNLEIQDLAHNDPETFAYLFHQTQYDLYHNWNNCHINNDLFFQCVALEYSCLAKSLNIKCSQSKTLLTKLISVKDRDGQNASILIQNNIDIIAKFFSDFMTKIDTTMECQVKFVNLVTREAKIPSLMFHGTEFSAPVSQLHSDASESKFFDTTVIISERYMELKENVELEKSEFICYRESQKVGTSKKYIEYNEIKNVLISWKRKLVELFLHDNSVVAVSFFYKPITKMETFLTLLDLFYRFHVKSQMILEPVAGQGLKFDSVAMKYNDLNFDETATNMYNIMKRCTDTLYYIDYKIAERMLREYCSQSGWYIIFNQEGGLYLLFLVFNPNNIGQVVRKPITHEDGRFWLLEKNKTYSSLQRLINSITIMIEQKEVRLNFCVTEEMSFDMRKSFLFDDQEHKSMHLISQYCLLTYFVCREFACEVYEGYWTSPCGVMNFKNQDQTRIRSFKYDSDMFGDNWYKFLEEEVQKVTKPEVHHQNILTCYGMCPKPRLGQTHVVFEHFGDNLQVSIMDSVFKSEELFDFGWQIISGLLFLHNQEIVHGFPALHNIYIDPTRKNVKIAKIGILSCMLRGLENHSDKFFLFDDSDTVNRPNVGYHPGRWLHRNILLLNDTIKEEVDRYVFGCTLWQLFNKGDLPLKNVTDIEIVEKLKSKESGWFKVVLKMPHTRTEFYKKLQKIIHICNTWGDNSEKYRFEEVATLYEDLKGIASDNTPTCNEYMIQKQGDSLVFIQTNKEIGQTLKPNNLHTTTYRSADISMQECLKNDEMPDACDVIFQSPVVSLLTDAQLESIVMKEMLGIGQFGHVKRGVVTLDSGKLTVALKIFPKVNMDQDGGLTIEDILREGHNMMNMRHVFIVPLLGMREFGAWTMDHSIQIVLPYYPCGSLNTYLDQQHTLSVDRLSCYGYQIACGMEYIHSKNIIHRALAARNILVANENHVVISDFMLSRDTSDCGYYYSSKNRTLPLLWYPPEYFTSNKFSKAADVWSYGVTCWEIFSSGQQPYCDVEELVDKPETTLRENLSKHFKSGKTLPIPEDMPLPFHHIMKDCFQINKDDRGDFTMITTCLKKNNIIMHHIEESLKELSLDGVVVVEKNGFSNGTKATEKIENVKKDVEEKGHLMNLSDFTFTSGKHPEPGQQVDAICRKFSLNHNVWVKAYTKSSNVAHDDFVEEVNRLLEFEHKNIVPLKGCVIQDNMLMLVTPCYNFGTLRDYLDNEKDGIKDKQKKTYCKQIASGMQYLSSHNCVHRDLRLCHVYLKNTNNLVIADFGLSRMCEAMYYHQHRNIGSDAFVVYPPEVIEQMCSGSSVKFSTACDVWSYGILLWELYSSNVAYDDIWEDGTIVPSKLHTFFSENKRLLIGNEWPVYIKDIISVCWREKNSRVSFDDIVEILNQ